MLEGGDRPYFGINWKWLIICQEQHLLHLIYVDEYIYSVNIH